MNVSFKDAFIELVENTHESVWRFEFLTVHIRNEADPWKEKCRVSSGPTRRDGLGWDGTGRGVSHLGGTEWAGPAVSQFTTGRDGPDHDFMV